MNNLIEGVKVTMRVALEQLGYSDAQIPSMIETHLDVCVTTAQAAFDAKLDEYKQMPRQFAIGRAIHAARYAAFEWIQANAGPT
jgi:hypothetical protein